MRLYEANCGDENYSSNKNKDLSFENLKTPREEENEEEFN